MKTVEELIERVRRETRNATTGSTTAGASISDAFFVDKLQDAQELAVELVTGVFSTLFEKVYVHTIDTTVSNYEIIDLPTDLAFGTRLSLVEYSYTGRDNDYCNLQPLDIRSRYTGTSYLRSSFGYSQIGSQIILSERPAHNGAKVRITYDRQLRRLDVPKAFCIAITERVSTSFTGFYTVSTANADFIDALDVGDLVSVLDRATNTVVIENASLSSINTGTGAFLLDLADATYTTAVVDAVADVNFRLIEGGRTNVSELPNEFEKFLVAHAVVSTLGFDGSRLAKAAEMRLAEIQSSLMKNYLFASKDWKAVPTEDY